LKCEKIKKINSDGISFENRLTESNQLRMKKLILAAGIFATAAVVNTANAQRPTLGIKGGLNFTGLSNLAGEERTSFHAGLFLRSRMNGSWTLQPELLYSAQGQHFRNEADQKRILALDYVQLPFMFQYHPAHRFYLEVGPQAGVLVSAKTKEPGTDNDKNNVEESYRKDDVAINAGLGVNVCHNFDIYGRYSQGLIDVTKSENITRTNHGFQLGGAIRF